MSAIVIGMGVAGQTAAISLSKNGYKVKIFEKSKHVLSAVGAGIAITGGLFCELFKQHYKHLNISKMNLFD